MMDTAEVDAAEAEDTTGINSLLFFSLSFPFALLRMSANRSGTVMDCRVSNCVD